MQRILIIEDEVDLVATVEFNLRQEGYDPVSATTGRAGLELARSQPAPDLILLDLMLPDLSGTEICRKLKANPGTASIPVIMCTARSSEVDRVVGFELGADDYVVKPFSVRELMLRVRAVLKRSQNPEPTGAHEELKETFSFGLIRVDEGAHKVWVRETEAPVTALEFRLLKTFMSRRGRVQSRERLLQDVWEYEADVTTRTVDTHIRRLRDKLGPVAGDYIETVRGVGYRMREQP